MLDLPSCRGPVSNGIRIPRSLHQGGPVEGHSTVLFRNPLLFDRRRARQQASQG